MYINSTDATDVLSETVIPTTATTVITPGPTAFSEPDGEPTYV